MPRLARPMFALVEKSASGQKLSRDINNVTVTMARVKHIQAKRVKGMLELARKLRVTRQHLYLVIKGGRVGSNRITSALKKHGVI